MYLITDELVYLPTREGKWELLWHKVKEVLEYVPGEEPTEILFLKNQMYSTPPNENLGKKYPSELQGYCPRHNTLVPVRLRIERRYTATSLEGNPIKKARETIPFRYTPLYSVECLLCNSRIKPEHVFLQKYPTLLEGFFEFRGIEPDLSVLV